MIVTLTCSTQHSFNRAPETQFLCVPRTWSLNVILWLTERCIKLSFSYAFQQMKTINLFYTVLITSRRVSFILSSRTPKKVPNCPFLTLQILRFHLSFAMNIFLFCTFTNSTFSCTRIFIYLCTKPHSIYNTFLWEIDLKQNGLSCLHIR